MKEVILLLITLLLANITFGQRAAKYVNKHRRCEMKFIAGDSILICRSPSYALSPMYGHDSKGISYIQSLEIDLDNAKYKVTSGGQTIDLDHAKDILTKLGAHLPDLNVKPYRDEISFYTKTIENRRKQKQYQDSVQTAVEEQNAIAWRKQVREMDIKDSIKKVNKQLAAEKSYKDFDTKFRKECVKKWGSKIGNMVADGKVGIGMTKEMCVMALGRPDKQSETLQGVQKYLTYYYWDAGCVISFKDGKIFSITK